MSRPAGLGVAVARHLIAGSLSRKKRFPLVAMIEPLEACNLECIGCGRVREYRDVMDRRLTVDECLAAARAAGTPIVSISGGEPLLHRQIGEIVRALIDDRRYIYLCTNGLLLQESLDRFPRSRRLAFVVHLDGTAAIHDQITQRPGSYDIAVSAIREAVARGYRVCTNTTLFHDSDVDDLNQLFPTVSRLGVEGLMISAGYSYEDVPNQEVFLRRRESIERFRRILDPASDLPFYNNPLYLDFLRGERTYDCAAWTTATFTVLGWRLPCYALADRHVDDIEGLLADEVWEAYGPGKDPRCTDCRMHSSFEGASLLHALRHPRELLRLAGAVRR